MKNIGNAICIVVFMKHEYDMKYENELKHEHEREKQYGMNAERDKDRLCVTSHFYRL